jgi:hypothetical protein
MTGRFARQDDGQRLRFLQQLHCRRHVARALTAFLPAVFVGHSRHGAAGDAEFGADRVEGLVGVLVAVLYGHDEGIGVQRHGDAPLDKAVMGEAGDPPAVPGADRDAGGNLADQRHVVKDYNLKY